MVCQQHFGKQRSQVLDARCRKGSCPFFFQCTDEAFVFFLKIHYDYISLTLHSLHRAISMEFKFSFIFILDLCKSPKELVLINSKQLFIGDKDGA